ncbi:KpsF/GutQ family sugar-phosphate isomerase [Phragmitibacter flavus]|uniref:KpsF/GutQ family sugar-phosphate isomerase n=1 Tax=Phragmitibacter flavus TaxID=2576071 RepID=A0A5R8KE94_9BACT|nr:KpsF/GutQ family sugar-phosphate isomerase [Phragmitibacter flavus]
MLTFLTVNYSELARRVIEIEMAELNRLGARIGESGSFEQAVDLLRDALLVTRKIVVCGVGKNGSIARKFAATLNSTGATSVILNAQDALHGDLGMVDEGDVVVLMSYSGGTRELVDLLPHLRRLNVKIIGITGNAQSVLAQHADVVLDVQVEREACPLGLAPTSSTTTMLVLCDALAMVLLEVRGFQADDFAKYHPNGAIGRALLTRVSDVMRSGDALALVGPGDTVGLALEVITKARAGAAVVVDEVGRLVGIFTHGDFVRAFQMEPMIAGKAVEAYMTRQPLTIREDRLATEVLALLEQRRVDELVVVNEVGVPVGLVDTQDLTRLKWV